MENTKLFEESSRAVKMSSDIIEQCGGLQYIWNVLINAETEGPKLDDGKLVEMGVLMGNALDIIKEANDGVYQFVEKICCDAGLVEHSKKHGLEQKPDGVIEKESPTQTDTREKTRWQKLDKEKILNKISTESMSTTYRQSIIKLVQEVLVDLVDGSGTGDDDKKLVGLEALMVMLHDDFERLEENLDSIHYAIEHDEDSLTVAPVDFTEPQGTLDNIRAWAHIINGSMDALKLGVNAIESDETDNVDIRNGAFTVLNTTIKEIGKAGAAIELLCMDIKEGKQERTDILSPV